MTVRQAVKPELECSQLIVALLTKFYSSNVHEIELAVFNKSLFFLLQNFQQLGLYRDLMEAYLQSRVMGVLVELERRGYIEIEKNDGSAMAISIKPKGGNGMYHMLVDDLKYTQSLSPGTAEHFVRAVGYYRKCLG